MDKPDIICANIRATIINIALREEAILRQAGKGIFFMPELAFAYDVGKEIYLTRKAVLLDESYEWKREEKVAEGYGIADLIFENGKREDRIVFEFKVLSKDYKYKADILKLKELPKENLKLFCSLEEVFTKSINDESNRRIKRIAADYKDSISKVGEDFYFSTDLKPRYQQDVVCFVELWRVH